MKNKVYNGLDVLKVLAAIGIVAVHTGATGINTLGRLGVPFFAIVSSMLFFSKYEQMGRVQQSKYLIHFIKRIGTLFLCWQVFYLPSAAIYLVHDMHQYGTENGSLQFIRHFIFPPLPLTNGWGQSWYLIGMLIGMPLFILILKALKQVITGVLCLLLYLFYVVYCTGYHFWNGLHYLPHWLVYFFGTVGSRSFPILLIFIFLGLTIVQKIKYINSLTTKLATQIMLIALVGYSLENLILLKQIGEIDNVMVLMTGPASFMLAVFGMKWQVKLKNGLFWRRFSTFLYCIHIGIIHCFDVVKIILQVQLNAFFVMTITIIISYLVYLLFNYLLEKRKWHWLKWLV